MKRTGVTAADIHACRLMIVDDVPVNCELIASYLELAGFSTIVMAVDGVDALEKIAGAPPDLMLLDLSMPRMDGFEVCRRIRSDPDLADMPILVETALDAPEQRADAFRAGATDLVTKPINRDELIARVRIHLERRLLIGNLIEFRNRLAGELAMARRMQAAMLPSHRRITRIESEFGLRIAAHFEPSDELGGDFWGMRRLTGGRLGIFLVDFTGHGVTAAMNTFRLQSLMGDRWRFADDPAGFLTELNRALLPLLPSNQFATMLYGIIDPVDHRFTFAAAASTEPMVGRPGEDGLAKGDGAGLPLGVSRSATYETRSLSFDPGALMFLYSDALLDPTEGDGAASPERLLDATVGQAFATAAQQPPLETILDDFRRRHGNKPNDDVTAIVVQSMIPVTNP